MGQRLTRTEDSNITETIKAKPDQIVSTKETLLYNFDQFDTKFRKNMTINEERFKNLQDSKLLFDKTDLINNTNLKHNFSSPQLQNKIENRTYSTAHSSPRTDFLDFMTKSSLKVSLRNNFNMLFNKENTESSNNRSIAYNRSSENLKIYDISNVDSNVSNNISKIVDLYKVESLVVEDFSDFEIKTIQLTYKFIKDDLNNLGVIAFMKSFETLPDLIDKFDSLKFLPLDELSKSHALRTHSKKVMNIIDQFVISLEENKLEEMKQKLYALGERHQIYRAKKSYFVVIEHQFINAIKPIITKNLQIIQKNQLIQVNENFSTTFDDQFHSIEDDLCIDTYLNNYEIAKTFELVKLVWHKVFEVIRFNMNMGMDSFEKKIKSSN